MTGYCCLVCRASLIQRKDVINNWPNVSGLQQATDLAQLLTARFDDEVDEPYS